MSMNSIRYVGTGKQGQHVYQISFSVNHGVSWNKKELKPGNTFIFPPSMTDINLDGMPLQKDRSYVIRNGNLAIV